MDVRVHAGSHECGTSGHAWSGRVPWGSCRVEAGALVPSDPGLEPKHDVFFRNAYFAFNFKGDHYSSNQNWF